MNEFDRYLLIESLSDLRAFLLKNGPHVASTSAVRENTSAIESVMRKLKRDSLETQAFSPQELKVMYWSVFDLRASTREVLETSPLSDPDRAASLKTQRACNNLLRTLADSLSLAGIDIRSLFRDS